jgi:hypothetical protein
LRLFSQSGIRSTPIPRTASRMLRYVRPAFRLVCLVTVISLGGVPQSLGQSGGISEYDVKAIFLYNFAKFVEWPANAFPDAKAPITVCIFGDDPFGSTLDDIVRGKTINDRGLTIRRIRKPEDTRGCQILFVSNTEDRRLSAILASVSGSSVLVIGDSEDFADLGGGIQFFLEDTKVHFAINVDAIQRAHLSVSAKLLALAKIVHDGSRPKGG